MCGVKTIIGPVYIIIALEVREAVINIAKHKSPDEISKIKGSGFPGYLFNIRNINPIQNEIPPTI